MLGDLAEKKKPLFKLKNRVFLKSRKKHFFNGVNPCSWTKNATFFFT